MARVMDSTVRMDDANTSERPWSIQLFRFALVGVVGFLADAGSLQIYLALLPDHFFSGRAISYIVAASTTWMLNARFTFGQPSSAGLRQWGRFVVFNLSGGGVNYAVYALLIASEPFIASHPALGVAAGSISGLGVNFAVSRKFVFTANRQ